MTSDIDQADRMETHIERLGLWVVRIAALPFLLVGIALWAAIAGAAVLVRGLVVAARRLGPPRGPRARIAPRATVLHHAAIAPARGRISPRATGVRPR